MKKPRAWRIREGMETVQSLRERFMHSRPAPLPVEAREVLRRRRRRHREFVPAWGWWVIGFAVAFVVAAAAFLHFGEQAVVASLPLAALWFGIVVTVLAALLVYFLPAIVALNYGIRRKYAVSTLNLLLGWTFVGWAVALVWAIAEAESR